VNLQYFLGLNVKNTVLIGYEALYEGGEVKLGDHHDKYEWVDIKTFKPEDYFVDGWLEGVQEYLAKH